MPLANNSAVGLRDWIAWGWAPYLCRLEDGWEWSEGNAATGVSLPLPGGLQGTCSVLACEHACALHRVELVRGSPGLSVASRLLCLPPPVPPDTPDAPGAPADTETPPAPPDLPAQQRPWPGLDHLGAIQASGGLILGLIALFSSYDHITAFGRSIGLQQQWGIPLIIASVATVFIDSQLATRARDRARDRADQAALEAKRERSRAADEADRRENEANRERNRADQERNRAAEARERQAETAERQRKSFERLDQAALLSARVQLDPSTTNRDRLRAFLILMAQRPLEDGDAGMA